MIRRIGIPLLLAVSLSAWGSPPSAEWLNEPVTMSRADILNLYSGVFNAMANDQMQATGAFKGVLLQMQINLVDREGRTRVDMLATEKAIADVQAMSAGKQTAELRKLHTELVKAIIAVNGGNREGMFNHYDGAGSPIAGMVHGFLKGRQPEDFIVSLGFVKDGQKYLYASVSHDQVYFNPDAPVASR